MRVRLQRDARPQAMTLLAAATISILLWYLPYVGFIAYPFRLFVTFIHEGGHAIAALLTGNSVLSLSVETNASGLTYTTQGGLFSQVFVSSAGYVGSMLFGAFLLILIRKSVKSRLVLASSAILVFILTILFGLIKPLFGGVGWSSIPFTFVAGTVISVGLFLVARFASTKVTSFLVSFLAVQCILNALYDLKTLFLLSSPFGPSVHTDAVNMANATGIPSIFWAVLWIGLALGILWFAMRMYVAGRDKGFQPDLPFEETPQF